MSSKDTLYIACDSEALRFNPYPDSLKQRILNKHFVYSVLISDSVTIPVGCYFESLLVQNLVDRYKDLFFPHNDQYPIAGLGLGNDRESFLDDIRIKGDWFPEEYGYKDNEKAAALFKRIYDITPRFRYGKMRKKLTNSILSDIGPNGDSFILLSNQDDLPFSATEGLKPLEKIVCIQEYALLPPYIEIEMERHGIANNRILKQWLDYILFKNYVLSCEATYNAYCNNPFVTKYPPNFRQVYSCEVDSRDTLLFEQFVSVFPFNGADTIIDLNADQIIDFKESDYFQHYLYCYNTIIERIQSKLSLHIPKLEYEIVKDLVQSEKNKEFRSLKNLMSNANEAIALYKTLRKPFWKRHCDGIAFQNWMRSRDAEFPLISLLSEIEDNKNGFLPHYINELYYSSEKTYNNIKDKRRKPLMNNSIINIIFPGAVGNTVESKVNVSSDTSHTDINSSKKNQPSSDKTNGATAKVSDKEKPETTSKRFAVALSFPGEFRPVVSKVADLLCNELGQEKVLYDLYYEDEFARRNLDVYLQDLYKNDSELVVVFFGCNYYEKPWCETEGRAIRALQSDKKEAGRVMYIRLGEGEIDGFFGNIDGSFDAYNKKRSPEELASAIIKRLNFERSHRKDD